MVRLESALALAVALCSSACTVVADVDYRRGDGNEAGDFSFTGTVNFHTLYYLDPDAIYARELDVELGVDLPVQIAFRTNDDEWTSGLEGVICEFGSISAARSSTSPGLDRRLAQAVGASGSLCITDQGDAGTDRIAFQPSRLGDPPPGQEGYLPSEIYVQLGLEGDLPPNVYRGTEGHPEVSQSPLKAGVFTHQLFEGGLPLTSAHGTLNVSIEVLR